MQIGDLIAVVLPALLGGGALGAVLVKRMNRNVDNATADNLEAQAAHTARQAAASEVAVIREVLAEVRENDARKTAELAELRERIEKLEERERHMLTRAAVHEAWDQMAFAMLLSMNPQHPPPPPILVGPEIDR